MAALRSFRGRCSLATYLGVITRRIVVRRLAEHRFSSALGHVNAHHAAVDFASTDNSSVQQLEHRDQVESLLSKLPQEPRQLAKWLFLDELSYLEISQRLAKPLNSIGPLVSRLRSLLQRCDSFPLAKNNTLRVRQVLMNNEFKIFPCCIYGTLLAVGIVRLGWMVGAAALRIECRRAS